MSRRNHKFRVHGAGAARSKYRSQKVEYDGIKFDSKHERDRYIDLKLMERAGVIRDLKLQVPIRVTIGGIEIRYVESKRHLTYRADFQYYDVERDRLVHEDAKGYATREYKMKRALLAAMGIEIVEV